MFTSNSVVEMQNSSSIIRKKVYRRKAMKRKEEPLLFKQLKTANTL